MTAHHTVTRRWLRRELQAAIAATGGVSQGVDVYRVPPSWSDALQMVSGQGPDALLQLIHAAEEEDLQGEKWPQSKCHDDKAIAAVFFTLEDR